MKKEFIKIAKELGFDIPIVKYARPEMYSVVYYVTIYKQGKYIAEEDFGYFIGEIDTANSKDRVIPNFIEFLNTLKIK